MVWKSLNESVDGTSHRASRTVCQDASFVTPFRLEDDELLILACADGAGSASDSHIGSQQACEAATKQAISFLESGGTVATIDESTLREWFGATHAHIEEEAKQRSRTPRDLASTLLLSVISAKRAVFAQIGDGAIVIGDGGGYRPIFWPQHGEYQNMTFFITDTEFEKHIQFCLLPQVVDEIAMFTDGLQMLALNFAKNTAHEPFFLPMFKNLRSVSDCHDLILPLREFLDSRGVNERTDDDKTLILATRVPSADTIL
jgi:protein phosphatase 2C-like protein